MFICPEEHPRKIVFVAMAAILLIGFNSGLARAKEKLPDYTKVVSQAILDQSGIPLVILHANRGKEDLSQLPFVKGSLLLMGGYPFKRWEVRVYLPFPRPQNPIAPSPKIQKVSKMVETAAIEPEAKKKKPDEILLETHVQMG